MEHFYFRNMAFYMLRKKHQSTAITMKKVTALTVRLKYQIQHHIFLDTDEHDSIAGEYPSI